MKLLIVSTIKIQKPIFISLKQLEVYIRFITITERSEKTLMPEVYSNKYHDSFLQYHIAFFKNNHIALERYEEIIYSNVRSSNKDPSLDKPIMFL
ncbi:MAG: hypothetical protein ACQEWV_16035 [Bacillota bacterium]